MGTRRRAASWVRIHESNRRVGGGVLASWDTTLVPNGPYTVRVRLEDAERGTLRFSVPIVVDNGTEGAQADTAPFAQITNPQAGQVLSGRVALGGLAFSGALQEVGIEVRARPAADRVGDHPPRHAGERDRLARVLGHDPGR